MVPSNQQTNQGASTNPAANHRRIFSSKLPWCLRNKRNETNVQKKEAAKAASYHPQIKIRMHASATTGSNCLALFARKSARISLVLFAAL